MIWYVWFLISLVIGLAPKAFHRILNLQYFVFKVIFKLISWWSSNHLDFLANPWCETIGNILVHINYDTFYIFYMISTPPNCSPLWLGISFPFSVYLKTKWTYTNGYVVNLESIGGWNELMAHKLIQETLNVRIFYVSQVALWNL